MATSIQYFGGICNLLFYPADGSSIAHPNLRYAPLNLHDVNSHNTLIFTIISCIICRETAIYRLRVLLSLLQVVLLLDPAQFSVQARANSFRLPRGLRFLIGEIVQISRLIFIILYNDQQMHN
jgi:hypothetical protein